MKAEDPTLLLAEIQRLKVELARKPATSPTPAPVTIPDTKRTDLRAVERALHQVEKVVQALGTAAGRVDIWSARLASSAKVLQVELQRLRHPNPLASRIQVERPEEAAARYYSKGVLPEVKILPLVETSNGHGLDKGSRVVLTAIAQHPDGMTREQLGVVAGYRRSSRNTYLQRLQARGLVVAEGGRLVATAAAVTALGADYQPLPVGNALREHWLGKLSGGEQKILKLLVDQYPAGVARPTIDEATNYRRNSRNTYLQRLIARGLVTASGGQEGMVRASDQLFDR